MIETVPGLILLICVVAGLSALLSMAGGPDPGDPSSAVAIIFFGILIGLMAIAYGIGSGDFVFDWMREPPVERRESNDDN